MVSLLFILSLKTNFGNWSSVPPCIVLPYAAVGPNKVRELGFNMQRVWERTRNMMLATTAAETFDFNNLFQINTRVQIVFGFGQKFSDTLVSKLK